MLRSFFLAVHIFEQTNKPPFNINYFEFEGILEVKTAVPTSPFAKTTKNRNNDAENGQAFTVVNPFLSSYFATF